MALAHNALAIATTQSIFLGLAWIFVLVRLYIRKFLVHGIAIDDYFLLVTVSLYSVFAASISVTASVHIFNHPADPDIFLESLDSVGRGVHYFYLGEIFYVITAAFLRLTVGLLLLRIAHTRAQRTTIYVAMLLMVLMSTAFLGVVIFQCTPVGYYWDFAPGAVGTCRKREVLAGTAYAHAAISFISDWTLGLLPIWLLWNVQISRTKKIGVGCMLGLGLLCGVAAITRTVYIGKLDAANFEANWIGLALCSVIEPGLGIIAASIAAFRPIFGTQWFKNLSSKHSKATDKWTRSSFQKSAKKQKENQMSPAFTEITLEKTQREDGGGSREGDVDERRGIRDEVVLKKRVDVDQAEFGGLSTK